MLLLVAMRATLFRFGLFGMLFLFVLMGLYDVSAATVKGRVYDLYLEDITKAVITLDSTPEQTLVSKNGMYSFVVPNGRYKLIALYEENDTLYRTEEDLIITADGTYVIDLILVPQIDEAPGADNETTSEFVAFETQTSPLGLVITLIVVLFFLMYIILSKAHFIEEDHEAHKKQETPVVQQPHVEQPTILPEGEDSTDKLLAFIRESGGRVTQKDMRKKFQLSEAKISLLIADLESKNLIRKIKRGRGNIIVLP